MDPRHLVGIDERLTAQMCVYCGAEPSTRDHVPSKVFLDEPYPQGLPVVGACESCNSGFSLDEQYLACFIECVKTGSADPADLHRPKIKRILAETPGLRQRIAASMTRNGRESWWQPESERVHKVVLKLAKGHAACELFSQLDNPVQVEIRVLPTQSPEERSSFESGPWEIFAPWPEIGSRAFHRAAGARVDHFRQQGDWVIVQPERYRFAVNQTGGVEVRLVLSEYLGCVVSWE